MLGVDREVVWEYDEYIHLFHKREFNEKMEPEKGNIQHVVRLHLFR